MIQNNLNASPGQDLGEHLNYFELSEIETTTMEKLLHVAILSNSEHIYTVFLLNKV